VLEPAAMVLLVQMVALVRLDSLALPDQQVLKVCCRCMHTHTHNSFTALLDFVRDYPGEPTPERLKPIRIYWSRDSEWHWHQLGCMQIFTLTQTHNHTSIPPLTFLQVGCPSFHPTYSVKALKE